MNMKNKQMITTVIIVLIVGGASFFGGIKYQQSKRMTFGGPAGTQGGTLRGPNGTIQRGGMASGFAPVTGEIIASDDKSITVKLPDGSSKIVFLSDATSVNKAEAGTKLDLTEGTKVSVFGQTNSDGSVTAQSVQINPMERMMRQGM